MRIFTVLFALLSATVLVAQDPGDNFFAQWNIHEIRFQFSQPGFWDSLTVNYTLDQYMSATVTIDGVTYAQSGVKYKGNSSYNNPGNKKPFRIDLAEYVNDQAHDGLKKLVLNNGFKDPTFLREKIMLDFLNEHGIAAPRCGFARLYINNEFRGLYTVVEDVNKTFLSDRFDNKSGNLFKGDPHGSLTWKGADQSLYAGDYELKTNETTNNWSDLVRFLDVLNHVPSPQLVDSLPKYMNVDSWLDYWAAHNLFVNLDSYIGSGHNYFIYHNDDTGQFEWITWDVNEAFGNFQINIPLSNLKVLPFGFIPSPATQRPMMNRLWSEPYWKQALANHLCTLLADFSNSKLDARIDSLANLIRQDVYSDNFKTYSNTQFEQNLTQDISVGVPGSPGGGSVAGLKPFISARRTSLLQQLSGYGCLGTDTQEQSGQTTLDIYPNPVSGSQFFIMAPNQPSVVQVFSADGRQLTMHRWSWENNRIVVDLPKILPPGIYTASVLYENGTRQQGKIAIL